MDSPVLPPGTDGIPLHALPPLFRPLLPGKRERRRGRSLGRKKRKRKEAEGGRRRQKKRQGSGKRERPCETFEDCLQCVCPGGAPLRPALPPLFFDKKR